MQSVFVDDVAIQVAQDRVERFLNVELVSVGLRSQSCDDD